MTIVSHAIIGGAISRVVYNDPLHLAIAITFSILPDLIHILDWVYGRKDWYYYTEAHKLKWWWLPYYNLHIFIDYIGHKQITGGWNKYMWIMEGICWTIIFITII